MRATPPTAPIPWPPRVRLAALPTPIQPLERLTRELGGPEIFVKRDDETGSELSGNKVRKLEFLLAEAREEGADIVLTCGGVQSNHCRATAVAARRLGMDSLLFLRGRDPGDRDGNLLLDALVGAELRFITPEEYGRRSAVMGEAAGRLRAAGRRPYVIPEGGSNGLGAFGYLAMVGELVAAAAAESGASAGSPNAFPWDHIVSATGSGGTLAGLVAGVRLHGLDTKVWGIAVCDSTLYFQTRVEEILGELRERLAEGRIAGEARSDRPAAGGAPEDAHIRIEAALRPPREEIRVLEGYKGPGYALAYPELLQMIRELARRDGLLLDPVYTGKAFYALIEEIRAGRFRKGERVLFLHTGGIFSLYSWRKELVGD